MPVLRCCDCVCNEVWYNPHKVAKPSDGGVSTMSLESIHTLTWSPNASDLDTVCTSHQPGAFRQSGHNPVSTSLERISACMCDHEVSNLIIDGTESQQRKYNASVYTSVEVTTHMAELFFPDMQETQVFKEQVFNQRQLRCGPINMETQPPPPPPLPDPPHHY